MQPAAPAPAINTEPEVGRKRAAELSSPDKEIS